MEMDPEMMAAIANSSVFEEQYSKYLANPHHVDPSWVKIFQQMERSPEVKQTIAHHSPDHEDVRVFDLIRAYRMYGHLMANINPIAISCLLEPPQLKLSTYGLSEAELNHSFPTYGMLPQKTALLSEIIHKLKSIYCDTIGYEYVYGENPELEKWIQERIETGDFRTQLSIEEKKLTLEYLNKSELLETFLHTKYVGQKRFSLEGGETLIPMLAEIIETAADLGAEEFILGMAHRGRLNVLASILKKSYAVIFSEFEEGYIPDSFEGSGDVKYHKGFASDLTSKKGKKLRISVAPNPSHLEAVYPVVEGQVRARQTLKDDQSREKVIPIIIHGDASIEGQGVVYETMQFCHLAGYETGGTVHIVINNQIGFTTVPTEGRSTLYCTDIAHTFGFPVFHVNAEDPEACIFASLLAIQIRQKFHMDVLVDINCYRKYGHNEGDEPAFTQPLEYQMIRQKKPIRELYRDYLIEEGIFEKSVLESMETDFKKSLQEELNNIKKIPTSNRNDSEKSEEPKPNFKHALEDIFKPSATSVPERTLKEVAEHFSTIPKGFTIHKKLENVIKERLEVFLEGKDQKPVDWGMAEFLAYGSLLWDDFHVRLSGQDSGRGTFSHRHAIWIDQREEKSYYPLAHIKPDQKKCEIYNSPLSEYGVLGFEYGYSVGYPHALVIWEAQFGDFCNGAQVVIDQFIATAEQKWGQKSSLVLLLPHSYEGQGPEHSSARMERFLALAGNNNMLIVNPSTPAQMFHLLRRQCVAPLFKPLIVFTPKGLLRNPQCVSSIRSLSEGYFQEILEESTPARKVKKIIFCSGHIYYDLIVERTERNIEDMLIVRIEQLYPLNIERLRAIIVKYHEAENYLWVQEEPSNMGAWDFIRPQLSESLPKGIKLQYAGRNRSASPAVGSYALHKKEQTLIMESVFSREGEA